MKNQLPGTKEVPTFHSESEEESFFNWYLRNLDDCKIKTKSDAYYVSAIALFSLTFLFPPFILGAMYCVIKAKKGEKK